MFLSCLSLFFCGILSFSHTKSLGTFERNRAAGSGKGSLVLARVILNLDVDSFERTRRDRWNF